MKREEEVENLCNQLIHRNWARTNAQDLAEWLISEGWHFNPYPDLQQQLTALEGQK